MSCGHIRIGDGAIANGSRTGRRDEEDVDAPFDDALSFVDVDGVVLLLLS